MQSDQSQRSDVNIDIYERNMKLVSIYVRPHAMKMSYGPPKFPLLSFARTDVIVGDERVL